MNRKDAEALVAEVEAAWNSHDMARFAACFATDADFVNVTGAWWRGRAEIEEKHAASHADMFKNSTMQVQLASFKEIGASIGLMHITWRLEGHAESGPTEDHRSTARSLVVDGSRAPKPARDHLLPQHGRARRLARIGGRSSPIKLRASRAVAHQGLQASTTAETRISHQASS